MSSFNPKALFTVVATASFILLGGCGSTQTKVTSVGPSMVGPGGGQQLGANSHRYRYNSDIYMDVAIPVFVPRLSYRKRWFDRLR